jgi:RNA 3'-terminal phosphate cyclase
MFQYFFSSIYKTNEKLKTEINNRSYPPSGGGESVSQKVKELGVRSTLERVESLNHM